MGSNNFTSFKLAHAYKESLGAALMACHTSDKHEHPDTRSESMSYDYKGSATDTSVDDEDRAAESESLSFEASVTDKLDNLDGCTVYTLVCQQVRRTRKQRGSFIVTSQRNPRKIEQKHLQIFQKRWTKWTSQYISIRKARDILKRFTWEIRNSMLAIR
jgi:hypothetical protein